jgi:hypothetical protein
MPILHLGPVKLEIIRRPFPGMMIPAVGEQDTANVQEQGCDRDCSFHVAGGWEVWRIGFVIA